MIDEHIERPDRELTQDDIRDLMHQWQCTKLIVNRAAADVVDRALGLERWFGLPVEQRALSAVPRCAGGPLMQPLSPNEAFEYIGRVALGLEPDAEIRSLIAHLQRESSAGEQ